MRRPSIAFFGSSLVSAFWNGAATYYRGIVRGLHDKGYDVTFYEPDAYDRQRHRDIPDPSWAHVVVYPATEAGVAAALDQGLHADIVVKTSGVGVFDPFLEAAVLESRPHAGMTIFWDVDAPATLERVHRDPADPFRALIPRYDLILTYGGGDPVVSAYQALGARACVPIYNALDSDTHHPVERDARFRAHLGFLGNRLPDREARVDEFFLRTAAQMPEHRFVLGGNGWGDKPMTRNVAYVGHVFTSDHNAFNSTPLAVLNITRDSMARCGFSPPTRVFEAAGAGACLITDAWKGIEQVLEPGREVLVAAAGSEVVHQLRELTPARAAAIGAAALRRVRAEHTYARRVEHLDELLLARAVRV
jgi:spore maturation protein CgeB